MKKKDTYRINIMKCSDLRVYKDNSRPVVFEDKRRKEKYKKKYEEELR